MFWATWLLSVVLLLSDSFNNSLKTSFFMFSVANKCRAQHTLLRAVSMHYSESNDQIDVTPFVQEVAFMYNPCVAFLKM